MTHNRREFLKMAGVALAAPAASKPNIVVILADDIGYGDLGCYGATRVRTPNVDRLAREGVRFTDAHAPASVCTPSRYSLLTGQYAWRNPAGDHILSGEAPLSIKDPTTTLPALLRGAGYKTGIVGKWHLGLGRGDLDWNRDIAPGPLEVGFDYAFYYPATADRVPCVYVENHRVVGLDPGDPLRTSYSGKIGSEPTGGEHPELLKLPINPNEGHDATIVNGISRIGYMSGGKAAWFDDEEIADTFARKAVGFLEANRSHPFFLYFATSNIHQPRWPNRRFRGSSGCGTRCDSIAEFDASVGSVLAALDRLRLTENTLVVLSSDNGPAMDDGYTSNDIRDAHGHRPAGALRGFKGSLWEGGHREPFLARWPRRIKPGSESGELLSLVDMAATCTAAAGVPLPSNAAPDSFNMLPALLGKPDKPLRDYLILQNNASRGLAIRRGPWKLMPAQAGKAPELYNLAADPAETADAAAKHPEIVRELSGLLLQARRSSRTRP